MKTTIKLFPLLAAATLALSVPGFVRADDAPAAATAPKAESKLPPRLEHRMKFLDENLKLTDDQKAQIKEIWTKANAELHEAQADAKAATRRARREKYREVMQNVHAQVRALLTPEQQKAFDNLPQEGRRRPKASGEV
ncbi:MAG TPA: Spy/CpxP family protein refolding chaperone [Opitutus sp.]|nr:Spy/CpxP family protein refolding chaperone [Opitutus sp.]